MYINRGTILPISSEILDVVTKYQCIIESESFVTITTGIRSEFIHCTWVPTYLLVTAFNYFEVRTDTVPTKYWDVGCTQHSTWLFNWSAFPKVFITSWSSIKGKWQTLTYWEFCMSEIMFRIWVKNKNANTGTIFSRILAELISTNLRLTEDFRSFNHFESSIGTYIFIILNKPPGTVVKNALKLDWKTFQCVQITNFMILIFIHVVEFRSANIT